MSAISKRIHWMALGPTVVGSLALRIQRCFDIAEFLVTGTINSTLPQKTQHLRYDEIAPRARDIFSQSLHQEVTHDGQTFDGIFSDLAKGTEPVQVLASPESPGRVGLEAILSSCVIGLWTTFETMAGDLWEAALNIHPAGLAELKGKKNRLIGPNDKDDLPAEEDETDSKNLKSAPLSEIIRREFDIKASMGSVLRTRQRFDHLAGIREAYGLAFHKKSDEIDKWVKHDGIDALNAVRNLLVHRSGVADATYARKEKYLKIPRTEIGARILLDGQIVSEFLRMSAVVSANLLLAVDKWVTEN